MTISYQQHTALEAAVERVNDILGFGRIEMRTQEFNPLDVTPCRVNFGVAWASIGTVEPEAALEYAEALAWAADMANALEAAEILVDYTAEDGEPEPEVFFDRVRDIVKAIESAQAIEIIKAI